MVNEEQAIKRPLMVGCSGGGGHNAAIKGIYQTLVAEGGHSFVEHYPAPPDESPAKIRLGTKAREYKLVQALGKYLPIPLLPSEEELIAAVEKLKEKNRPDSPRCYIDMLLDVFPGGYWGAAIWNVLQSQDKIAELKKLIAFQESNDRENHAAVKAHFLELLKKAAIDGTPYTEIISTQAMALPALCDAVIAYNEWTKTRASLDQPPTILVKQYMTDLPTAGAVHFFPSLERLSSEQASVMALHAVAKTKETITKHLGNSSDFSTIVPIQADKNPMVRAGFKKPANNKAGALEITYSKTPSDKPTYSFDESDKVACIMLGSQAGLDTVQYAQQLADEGYKVFVFGGKNNNIQAEIAKIKPQDNIIALGNQDDDDITQIMTRSEVIVTRSGGLSVMEQMAMPHHDKQKIFIHHADNDQDLMSSGISWEDDNANGLIEYLRPQVHSIEKTMPKHFTQHLKNVDKIKGARDNFQIKLDDEAQFTGQLQALNTLNPQSLACLLLVYQVDIEKAEAQRPNDEDANKLFEDIDEWLHALKTIQAHYKDYKTNHGEVIADNLLRAVYFHGLNQFTLSSITDKLSQDDNKQAKTDLLDYLVHQPQHELSKMQKEHELSHFHQNQTHLYLAQNDNPAKKLCGVIQSLIVDSKWKKGLFGQARVQVRKKSEGEGEGETTNNTIPRTMVKILKIIKNAQQTIPQDSSENNIWEEALQEIKRYIESKDLHKGNFYSYSATTQTYVMFKTMIEKEQTDINKNPVIVC